MAVTRWAKWRSFCERRSYLFIRCYTPGVISSLLRRSPAAVVSFLFCLLIFTLYLVVKGQTGGLFVYPLDDSYIHLALARNLALHHVWGIEPARFASASSSPGWTVLLASIDALAGPHLLVGLVLNVAFAVAFLFTVDYGLRSFAPSAKLWFHYAILLLIILGTPLVSLTLMGMEHTAQTFSVFLLVIFSVQILPMKPGVNISRWKKIAVVLLAMFAGAIRYETAFAIVMICGCLLARRRAWLSAAIGLAAAVPPVVFGLYFYRHSELWLPYSVVVKETQLSVPPVQFAIESFYRVAGSQFFVGVALAALLWILRYRGRGFWDPSELLLFLTAGITVLHLEFAKTGWLMRYEGYFYALLLFSLAVAASMAGSPRKIFRNGWAGPVWRKCAVCLAVIAVLLLAYQGVRRVGRGLVNAQRASEDRYLEHIQMARFASTSYGREPIVVNDIGAVAYYGDSHLLDMMGLGSLEVARAAHQRHPFHAAEMQAWASSEGASIAILQSEWQDVTRNIPPDWIKVWTWQIPRNVAFPLDYDISFFAINPGEVPRLCRNLNQFQLPPADKVVFISPACRQNKAATLQSQTTKAPHPPQSSFSAAQSHPATDAD
jgi:hypothetical protein